MYSIGLVTRPLKKSRTRGKTNPERAKSSPFGSNSRASNWVSWWNWNWNSSSSVISSKPGPKLAFSGLFFSAVAPEIP